jgi:hypothetical protein
MLFILPNEVLVRILEFCEKHTLILVVTCQRFRDLVYFNQNLRDVHSSNIWNQNKMVSATLIEQWIPHRKNWIRDMSEKRGHWFFIKVPLLTKCLMAGVWKGCEQKCWENIILMSPPSIYPIAEQNLKCNLLQYKYHIPHLDALNQLLKMKTQIPLGKRMDAVNSLLVVALIENKITTIDRFEVYKLIILCVTENNTNLIRLVGKRRIQDNLFTTLCQWMIDDANKLLIPMLVTFFREFNCDASVFDSDHILHYFNVREIDFRLVRFLFENKSSISGFPKVFLNKNGALNFWFDGEWII